MTQTDGILPLQQTIAPATEAEVAAAVRRACADGLAVYPIGGATAMDYGVRPTRPGMGLSLRLLNRLIDHAADDMTVTVEAGMTMAELSALLAGRSQRVPVDVARATEATIGGIVATNAAGPRRYACGTMRDYVLGLRAVDGQGTAFSCGGRVVKNAAGYNLCRLMIGSLGTLGVLTQVTLMVRPMPETSAMLACDLADLDAAERLLAGLIHTRTLPAAIELLAGPAAGAVPQLGPLAPASAARLVVAFEGTAPEVEWMIGRLSEEWAAEGILTPATIPAQQAAPVWSGLIELPADVLIHVQPSAVVAAVGQLLQLDAQASVQSHAGNGVIRVRFSPREAAALREMVCDHLRPAMASLGGNLVILSCPQANAWSADDIWGPPTDASAVMHAIKERFDPRGALNPGRFIF